MYVYILPAACMYGCRPEEGTRSIIDGCETPWGCWELSSVPLEEQAVLLTIEPFLQPYCCYFSISFSSYSLLPHRNEGFCVATLHTQNVKISLFGCYPIECQNYKSEYQVLFGEEQLTSHIVADMMTQPSRKTFCHLSEIQALIHYAAHSS